MNGWVDLTHMESIYAFAADQRADKEDFDLAKRRRFMCDLMRRNAESRQIRVNFGEKLYEMTPEPLNETNPVYDKMIEKSCVTRQNAKFNYVGKHKGKVLPKAKQLSDVYFEEQLMSDTYDRKGGF